MSLQHSTFKIGDTARFPIGRLGDEQVYRYRWALEAFQRDGCVIVRRLHDGVTRTIAPQWFERYRTDESYRRQQYDDGVRRSAQIQALRDRRKAEAVWQTDPTQPGFYVSAIDGRDRRRYALLLGPFADHYTALLFVKDGSWAAREYDLYGEHGYGTCRAQTSERRGKFNQEVFGHA